MGNGGALSGLNTLNPVAMISTSSGTHSPLSSRMPSASTPATSSVTRWTLGRANAR